MMVIVMTSSTSEKPLLEVDVVRIRRVAVTFIGLEWDETAGDPGTRLLPGTSSTADAPPNPTRCLVKNSVVLAPQRDSQGPA